MAWQLFVSIRYLTSKHREKFISIISLISVLGVAVGVAALIIVISVMSGFDEDLKDKIIGTYSHIEIMSDYGVKSSPELVNKILNTRHVKAMSFFLNGQALIRSKDNVTGVILKGIDPRGELSVKKIGRYIKEGSLELSDNNIVLGSELAGKLHVKIGDAVTLISGASAETGAFRVGGIFTSGMYEYDMNLVYIHISKAQELLGARDLASGVAVRLDDAFSVNSVKAALQEALGFPYVVRTWMDSNRNLLEALKLEKTVMFIILALIVMVACFNIASTLIMTSLEKTKDIGVLKAIGAANHNVMAIFALQGAIIGLLGTLLGTALGTGACWFLKTYKFINLPRDVYYIDKLPVKVDMREILVIVSASICITLIATIYPAYKAARLDPVEALRYE